MKACITRTTISKLSTYMVQVVRRPYWVLLLARRRSLPLLRRPLPTTRSQARAQCEGPRRCLCRTAGLGRSPPVHSTGRKSPGDEAESASLKRQDPQCAAPLGAGQGQLAIATVMWPVEMQSTNRTGLPLALTLACTLRTGGRPLLFGPDPAGSFCDIAHTS